MVMTSLNILILVLALSGLTQHRVLYSSEFSFALAIDTSKSMEADDFLPNRLETAKKTAEIFVDISPPGTRMAVLSFSGNSFIEQPMTGDKSLVKNALNEISLSSIGGTDLNEAVITGTNLLHGEESKSVILISDGKINVGTIDDAINYANFNDVIVHTIGIGTVQGGETSYGLSQIDEDSLRGLAFNTDGKYYRAENKEQLEEALNSIITLKLKKVPFNLSSNLIIVAMILIIIEFVLINTRFRILP